MISVLQFLRDVPAPSGPGTRRVMTFRQSAEKKCQPHGPLAGEQETVPRAPCGLAGAIAPRPVPGQAGKCTEFRGPPEMATPFPRIGKVFPPGRRKDAFSAPFGRCWRLLFVPLTVGDAAPLCREPVCRRTLLHRIRSGVFCGLFRRLCFAAGGVPARSAILGEAAVMARGTADLQDRLSGCPGSGGPAGAAGSRAGACGAGQRPDRVLPGFRAVHDRDAQGADATPLPSQARAGFAGGRDDLICGPRSDPPRVMPFRRW